MEDHAFHDGGALSASWLLAAVALLLAAKVVATIILLCRPAADRLRTRGGRALWWATKLTPVAAVPLAIVYAAREGLGEDLKLYLALLAFVAVAVPWKVWRHRHALRLVTPPS